MDPRETEYQLDDDTLEEIGTLLNSLTCNGSRPPRSNNDGSPSEAEMEKCQKDILEQRIQMTAFMEKSGEMEKKIGILQRDLKTSDSKIANLQSLLASEREDKAELEAKISTLNNAIQKTVDFVRARHAATEESIKSLKGGSKIDEAIEGLSNLSKEIEVRYIEVNENIQRLKESVEESNKRIQSHLEISKRSFPMGDEGQERVAEELCSIKVAMKEPENRIPSEIQLTATETDQNHSRADEIQQLNLTTLEQQRIIPEVPLTPAAAKGVDGSDKIFLAFTARDDDEEDEEDAVPQYEEQEIKFTLSSVAGQYKAASAVGPEIGSGNQNNSDPPSATTVQNQEVTQPLDRTTRGGVFCTCGHTCSQTSGEMLLSISNDEPVTKVEGTPKAIAPSPPPPATPSTSQSSSVAEKTHAHDITKRDGVFCTCGRKYSNEITLRAHILYYTAEKNFLCSLCPQRFLWLSSLRKHQMTKHKISPEIVARGCCKCGKICKTIKEQLGHYKFCYGGQVKKEEETPMAIAPSPPTPSTSKSASVAEKTPRHHGRDHAREMFCLCGRKFRKPRNLHEHLKHYAPEKKPARSIIMQRGEGVVSQSSLNQHAPRSPHWNKPSSMVTLKATSRSNICQNCGRSFKTTLQLAKHMRTVHRIKSRSALNYTRAVDTDGQEHKFVPHPPPTSSFEQSGSVPEGFDGFSCQCGKNFATRRGLVRHIGRIATKKSFECSECSRKFGEHFALKCHLMNVHKMNYSQGRFACLDCGETFDVYKYYFAHRLVVHGK